MRADMCIVEEGAVVTWLRVVSSHASTRTHTCTCTHVRGVYKQRTRAMVSDCAHTHVCCRSKEPVVTVAVAWIAHARSHPCVAEARG